jgi:hypothetical protein
MLEYSGSLASYITSNSDGRTNFCGHPLFDRGGRSRKAGRLHSRLPRRDFPLHRRKRTSDTASRLLLRITNLHTISHVLIQMLLQIPLDIVEDIRSQTKQMGSDHRLYVRDRGSFRQATRQGWIQRVFDREERGESEEAGARDLYVVA